MSKHSSPSTPSDKVDSTVTTEERRSIAPELILEQGSLTWEKYKLPIVASVALLVLALVGSEFYQSSLTRKASEASAQLDAAKTDAEYQKVIDTYPSSEAAVNAYLLLGRSKYNAKDYVGAQQAWQALADKFPKHSLVPGALTGVASALQAQGKLDEARSTYQRIATSYANSYAAPLARLAEADVLLSQRKTDDAKHVYEDLIATSQKGIAGQIAEQSLKSLNSLPPIDSVATPVPTPSAVPTPEISTPSAKPATNLVTPLPTAPMASSPGALPVASPEPAVNPAASPAAVP